jgi:DNA-binding protein YbaB
VLTAVNAALEQAQQISAAEMGKATQGFNLPGLM